MPRKRVPEFGKQLKSFRLKARLRRQRDLADVLAEHQDLVYDVSFISRLETGDRIPRDREVLVKFIEVLSAYGGIETIAQANEWLNCADHGNLTEEDIYRCFPEQTKNPKEWKQPSEVNIFYGNGQKAFVSKNGQVSSMIQIKYLGIPLVTIVVISVITLVVGYNLRVMLENSNLLTVSRLPNEPPATEDEIVVVLAEFDNPSGLPYQPEVDMTEVLEEAAKIVGNVRPLSIKQPIRGKDQAEEISHRYSATIVVYGRVTSGGVTASYLVNPRDKRVHGFVVDRTDLDTELTQRVSVEDVNNFEVFIYKGLDINYVLYLTVGQLYYHRQKYDEALRAYSIAEHVVDDSRAYRLQADTLHLYKGMAYWKLGDYEQAISSMTRVIDINPERAAAYLMRGSLYSMQGKNGEARTDLGRFLDITSGSNVELVNFFIDTSGEPAMGISLPMTDTYYSSGSDILDLDTLTYLIMISNMASVDSNAFTFKFDTPTYLTPINSTIIFSNVANLVYSGDLMSKSIPSVSNNASSTNRITFTITVTDSSDVSATNLTVSRSDRKFLLPLDKISYTLHISNANTSVFPDLQIISVHLIVSSTEYTN